MRKEECARIWLLLLLLRCLILPALGNTDDWDFDDVPSRQLRTLSDHNFEHDTQAGAGQTTGSWLVLFTDLHCAKCKDAELALLEGADQLEEEQTLLAQVNILDSPKISKRFQVSKVPALWLFRDRLMFAYKGDWSVAHIVAFVQGGWRSAVPEEVPAEASLAVELFEKWRQTCHVGIEYLAKRPGLLAGIGAVLATSTYMITRRLLVLKTAGHRKRKPNQPRGQSLKRK